VVSSLSAPPAATSGTAGATTGPHLSQRGMDAMMVVHSLVSSQMSAWIR
jgi:hypothetical protein